MSQKLKNLNGPSRNGTVKTRKGPIDYTREALCPHCWGKNEGAVFAIEDCDRYPSGRLRCPICSLQMRTKPLSNKNRSRRLFRY
jgi:hypothetical protein